METPVTASRPQFLSPPQPREAGAAPLDLIFIEGFRGEAVIGIHDDELHRSQPLVIDLAAGVPRSAACSSDRIGDTIDYSLVRDRLRLLMKENRLQLLEAFAQAVADTLIDDFGAAWVRVKVAKPRKFDDVEAVGVMIEREAGDQQASRQARTAAVVQLIGSGLAPRKK